MEVVKPNSWAALKLPTGATKMVKVAPNATISLGKYGSFPSNLIIGRPYHLTYEIQDRRPDECFSRLRMVLPVELHADAIADEDGPGCSANTGIHQLDATDTRSMAEPEADQVISASGGVEYSLVDAAIGAVEATSDRKVLDSTARQSLSQDQIEELKREGKGAGRDIIAKLLLSHTALDQKTSFSLAKYKLLKTRKYIRRFQVRPLDVALLANYLLEEKDAGKILDMKQEMLGLVGCWANVHFGGEATFLNDPESTNEQGAETCVRLNEELLSGRWLVVDDTCGLLVGAMAERMGILSKPAEEEDQEDVRKSEEDQKKKDGSTKGYAQVDKAMQDAQQTTTKPAGPIVQRWHSEGSDFRIPYSQKNTITQLHQAAQPNLTLLNYFGYDATDPNPPAHPLADHLLPISFLQLFHPDLDSTYATPPPTATEEELQSWKHGRRGNFHRKRRRFARTRYAVDQARAGNFDGLVCATAMEPISVLRATLPLLRGGASIAIYSPTREPLAALHDACSISRKSAWIAKPPEGYTYEQLLHWKGSDDFPLNPTLVINSQLHSAFLRKWQVLPGRTHPHMTQQGGAEGYLFTAWRSKPAEERIWARGKFTSRKRKADVDGGAE